MRHLVCLLTNPWAPQSCSSLLSLQTEAGYGWQSCVWPGAHQLHTWAKGLSLHTPSWKNPVHWWIWHNFMAWQQKKGKIKVRIGSIPHTLYFAVCNGDRNYKFPICAQFAVWEPTVFKVTGACRAVSEMTLKTKTTFMYHTCLQNFTIQITSWFLLLTGKNANQITKPKLWPNKTGKQNNHQEKIKTNTKPPTNPEKYKNPVKKTVIKEWQMGEELQKGQIIRKDR